MRYSVLGAALLATSVGVCMILTVAIVMLFTSPAWAQEAVPAIVTVTAEPAVISFGTIAGEVLTWAVAIFGSGLAAALITLIFKAFPGITKGIDDSRRQRITELLVNGLNAAGRALAAAGKDKFTITLKNQAIASAVEYAKLHGADLIKKLGDDPRDAKTTEALAGQAEKLLNDATVPTPANITPPATPTVVVAAAPAVTVAPAAPPAMAGPDRVRGAAV